MKGSEYQREVLAKQNKDLLDLSKITLKDKDFDIMKISWGKYYTDKPEADRNRVEY